MEMISDPLVYVIDDDDAVRELLGFLLQSRQIRVQSYESAKPFLAALPKLDGGCVITDVRMPEMSGLDLLRRLRELQVDMPVIVITGHGDLQLAVEAMKSGAVDFLEKPYDDECLLPPSDRRLSAGSRKLAGRPKKPECWIAWQPFRAANDKCWKGWWPETRTRSLPISLISVRALSKSIAPT